MQPHQSTYEELQSNAGFRDRRVALEEQGSSSIASRPPEEQGLRAALDLLAVPLVLVKVDLWGNESTPYMSRGCQILCNWSGADHSEGAAAFWSQIHPEDQETLQQMIRHAALTKGAICFDYRQVGAENALRWIRLKAVFQNDDSLDCGYSFYAFMQDVTEEKRAEAAPTPTEQILQASARRPEEIEREMPRTVLKFRDDSPGGWLSTVNNDCEVVYREREQALTDWNAAWEPVHPVDVSQAKDNISWAVNKREDLNQCIFTKPGKAKWHRAKSSLLAEGGKGCSQTSAEKSLAETEVQIRAASLEYLSLRNGCQHNNARHQHKDDDAAQIFGHAWRRKQSTATHSGPSSPTSPTPTSSLGDTHISEASLPGPGVESRRPDFVKEVAKRAQAELQILADVIPGGVLKFAILPSGEKRVLVVNKAAEKLLGVDAWELKLDFSLLWKHDSLSLFKEELANCSQTDCPLDVEYQSLVDGMETWIRAQAVCLPKAPDGSQEWTALLTDVSSYHAEEQMLKQDKLAAEEANRAKGRFLANMSHEIRTPMNAIIGMGRLLLETELSEEQCEFALTMQSSAEALLVIINDILDLSKIEAGRLELERNPFNLLDCVESCLDLIAPDIARKGLELCFVIDDTVPSYVVGDVSRVRQILLNLLGNAAKFTEHGSITVSVTSRQLTAAEGAEVDPVWVGDTAIDSLHELHFSIADTGIGIPPECQGALFKAFGQLDASTTRKYGGTGLGLTISSWLCSLQKGSIWVESKPDAEGQMHGATFHFTILAPQAPQSKKVFAKFRKRMDACSSTKERNVCIVEGKGGAKTSKTLQDHLLLLGMKAVVAESTSAACYLIREGFCRVPEIAPNSKEQDKGSPKSIAAVRAKERADSPMAEHGGVHGRVGEGKGEREPCSDIAVNLSLGLTDHEIGTPVLSRSPSGSKKDASKGLKGKGKCEDGCEVQAQGWDLVIVDQAALEEDGANELRELLLSGDAKGTAEQGEKNLQVPSLVLTPFGHAKSQICATVNLEGGVRSLSKPVKLSRLLAVLERFFMDDGGAGSPARSPVTKTSLDVTMGERCPLKILVAEDNLVNQRLLCRLLLKLGYAADVVCNGVQAVEAATQQRYDLLLMDCWMPVMDGLQATRIIRQTVSPCPTIVAVTAGVLDEDRHACAEAGMDMHMSKPILVEELVRMLSAVWAMRTGTGL